MSIAMTQAGSVASKMFVGAKNTVNMYQAWAVGQFDWLKTSVGSRFEREKAPGPRHVSNK